MSVAQLPLALKSPRQPGFENFVAGRSRPVVATLSLGLEPGGWYLVCGPRGSGRSHLLGAALADRIRHGEQAIFIGLKKTGQLDLRSEEHTSELQSRGQLVCRLLLETTNQSEVNHNLNLEVVD